MTARAAGGGDALRRRVADAARGEYDVVAELGHAPELGTAFLARDLATGAAALLVVAPDAEALDVVAALGDAVPAAAGRCTSCGAVARAWAAACARCGRSLAPTAPRGPADAPAADPALVAAAAGRTVAVVGAVPHAAGGVLYFGRDRVDGRLLAYAARPQGDGRVWLDVLWEAPADGAGAAAG